MQRAVPSSQAGTRPAKPNAYIPVPSLREEHLPQPHGISAAIDQLLRRRPNFKWASYHFFNDMTSTIF